MTARKPRNLGDAKLGTGSDRVRGFICTLPNGGVIGSDTGDYLRRRGVSEEELQRARDGERVVTIAGEIEHR
jgi:hypothetical protein